MTTDIKEGKEGTEGEEDVGQTNETALKHIDEFDTIRSTINDLHEKIEEEAGSITQDQKYFAEYLHGVKNFKPWMDEAETIAKTPVVKPTTLEEAMKLFEATKEFDAGCQENRTKLDNAAESRSMMEKQTKADDEVQTLNKRWDGVKKIIVDRVEKAEELVHAWTELQTVTEGLTTAITAVPLETTPDVAALEGIFRKFRELNDRKLKLLAAI